MRKALPAVLGIALLAGAVLSAWQIIERFGSYLASADPSVVAALITGALIAAGTIYVKHIEHRHSVEAEFRDAKVELYYGFMEMLDEMSADDAATKDFVPHLKEWKRKLLFHAGPQVVRASHSLGGLSESNTVGDLANSVQKVGTLILAMRKDLGLSNKSIARNIPSGLNLATVLGAKQMIRHPGVFLEHASQKPSMTMLEMNKHEKELDRELGLRPQRKKTKRRRRR